jgi:cytochrome c oxidase assembly protein subunit 15
MPFDATDFPGAAPRERASRPGSRRLVAAWLLTVNAMLLVMIVLGGATRLTGSGLSIMEWDPVGGALPPWSEAEWQRLFALYQQIPQYAALHAGFGLDGFKSIFWLEWTHRLWGRLIGLVFLLPLVWLWATGRVERRLRPRLAVIFALGGLQGAVGWLMVASGFLPDSTAVSPYRLVVHLVLALALYSAIFWTALSVLRPRGDRESGAKLRGMAGALVGCVALTIVAGGFVAGNHAGLAYNTFPLMDGALVPSSYADLSPFLRNLTENVAAVQFDHRLLATMTAILAAATVAVGIALARTRRELVTFVLLGAASGVQYALGVATLLWVVPVPLAAAHQAMAVLLLTAALAACHALRAPRRLRIGGGAGLGALHRSQLRSMEPGPRDRAGL